MLTRVLIFVVSSLTMAIPVMAAETKIDGTVILQYIAEENRDLGYGDNGDAQSVSEQIQMRYRRTFDKNRYVVANGRLFNINAKGLDNNSDEGDPSNPVLSGNDRFFELREAYCGHRNLWKNIELRLGRQRIREPRGLWWNSDNDLAALYYKDKQQRGLIAMGEDLGSYRLGMDELPRDENRFRVLGEYSRIVNEHLTIEPRFIFEHDHSGARNGFNTDQADQEDLTGLYAGLRAAGMFENETGAKFAYRADWIGLTGRQYVEGAQMGDVAGYNTLRAWAMDYGISAMPWADGLIVNANIAMASGDNDGDNDTEFRQTSLEGGSSRSELERTAQRNYGEVFRPELSNIRVLSAGVIYLAHPAWDVGVSYYHYAQMEADDDVRRAGVRADPDGNSTNLGQEIDVTIVGDLQKIFPASRKYLTGMQWRTVGGAFDPGDAFETGNDDPALRVFSELRFRF